MSCFRFADRALDLDACRALLADSSCGAYASFEGRVRNHNEGREVRALDYEAYETLGVKEGQRIIDEALARFAIERAACVHRTGALQLGDLAVWVGVSAHHRDAAFAACRYIIDEVKARVPIWKKEQYPEGHSGWINCEAVSTRDEPQDGSSG